MRIRMLGLVAGVLLAGPWALGGARNVMTWAQHSGMAPWGPQTTMSNGSQGTYDNGGAANQTWPAGMMMGPHGHYGGMAGR